MSSSRTPKVSLHLTVYTSRCTQPLAPFYDWFIPVTCNSCPQCFEKSISNNMPIKDINKNELKLKELNEGNYCCVKKGLFPLK